MWLAICVVCETVRIFGERPLAVVGLKFSQFSKFIKYDHLKMSYVVFLI